MAVKTRSKKKVFSEYEKLEKFNKAEEEAREDVKLFVAGIAFTFTVLWTMLEWGQAEGWYAPSPTIYNQPGQEDSRERFEQGPVECVMEEELCNTTEIGYYGPGCVTRWYYWKLRPEQAWSYTIPWAFYLMHQITVWAGVFYAQKLKDSEFAK
ncbi:unnamed protein product [Oikopleura dioica]|uniref:Uncharacterized protein n=1 Tax=Oikopleura dioica TaxID=34765 RepID=E4XME3_OIKDI|nr:unnamed protein product [Oikopleura dioica]